MLYISLILVRELIIEFVSPLETHITIMMLETTGDQLACTMDVLVKENFLNNYLFITIYEKNITVFN